MTVTPNPGVCRLEELKTWKLDASWHPSKMTPLTAVCRMVTTWKVDQTLLTSPRPSTSSYARRSSQSDLFIFWCLNNCLSFEMLDSSFWKHVARRTAAVLRCWAASSWNHALREYTAAVLRCWAVRFCKKSPNDRNGSLAYVYDLIIMWLTPDHPVYHGAQYQQEFEYSIVNQSPSFRLSIDVEL